jgi:hypothetical protein
MDHPAITPVMTHFAGGGDVDGNPGAGNDGQGRCCHLYTPRHNLCSLILITDSSWKIADAAQ